MTSPQRISNALISVFYKDGLDQVAQVLHEKGVAIYSTGGTQDFLEKLGIPVFPVEQLTGYPSILGGRVKTLHPKIFGGILARREDAQDLSELQEYKIPLFDLVMVDLYPFEETLNATNDESKIIEKIDIGGVSLIRAGAKNYKHTLIISDRNQYPELLNVLKSQDAISTIDQRRLFAGKAFQITAQYDRAIANYFANGHAKEGFSLDISQKNTLRYGENPHQKGFFYGNILEILEQKNGKELSYNNILDIDAAIHLLGEFSDPSLAIIKHNNPCGVATRKTVFEAWEHALAGDPVSAFGGIIALNRQVDFNLAQAIDKVFFEVLIAPSFEADALELLSAKKNRILLVQKAQITQTQTIRTSLNGFLVQDKDLVKLLEADLKLVTSHVANQQQVEDLLFADRISKHTKSNTIVLAKNQQLIGIGCGQTSRVDALKHAISKAKEFGFSLEGAVLCSDAFFPFPDCVEIAGKEGINAVLQPGGSIKDDLTIKFCEENGIAMYLSGIRHFKH